MNESRTALPYTGLGGGANAFSIPKGSTDLTGGTIRFKMFNYNISNTQKKHNRNPCTHHPDLRAANILSFLLFFLFLK